MIRSFFSGLILILLPFSLTAQWNNIVSPTDQIIYDVTFTAENQGWAVGLGGTILHYDGIAWEVYDLLPGNSFNRVVFTSENKGWAITGNGKIFHYDGNGWSLNFTATGGKGLYTLYFLETGEGYASGAEGYIAYYDGEHWIEGNIGFDVWTLTSYFADNKNGWLSAGAGKMYQFKDSVWSEITTTNPGAFIEMRFVSPDNGYGVGFGNSIWHYDGNSWSIDYTSINNTNHNLLDIHFLDENHGWASGEGSFFTYNYGVWTEELVDPDWEVWGFHFTDPYHGWGVGSDGLLLRYGPDPLDWQPSDEIPSHFRVNEISRSPQGDLYAIAHTDGVSPAESEVALYKSSDGLSWEKISSDLDLRSQTTTILAMQDVLLVSGYDKDFNFEVYKSVDNGLTWEVSMAGMSSQTFVQDMTIDENGIIYAVAKHVIPELYKSEDLGDSWTLITTNGFPVPTDPADGDFMNIASIGTTLFAFHTESENNVRAIYTSSDGVNWIALANTPDKFFAVDLHVSEGGLLYASGGIIDVPFGNNVKGIVYVSGDQGNSWQVIDTGSLGDYGAIYFSIASIGSELLLSTTNANVDRDFKVFTTVKPQIQSINFGVLSSKTYGDPTFEPVASTTSGLPIEYNSANPEVALVNGNSISINGAGVTTITASQPGNASFHAANNVEQLLTVDKATLNVTVVNVSRDEGEPNPVFELRYEGWVGGDDINDLDVIPIASTTADIPSDEGTYPITISGGMDNNYNFDYTAGILTVNNVEEVITALEKHSTTGIKIFPNPVSYKLKLIPGPSAISGLAIIYNSTGAIIKSIRFNGKALEMDFSAYPSGIYLLKIISADGSTVHQIVKE
ncbi:MBG domain-containing protein [Fulvivirgaceae bacterium BMA12]|uniref:MBG domain-containing protein n=1 Tax=Agaribacillus aureus TaxID=3051825 RepID=A0ABT8LD66_9BACT|nr:MBG domain-containing protein [Fulvivirgaceae bacterium BMA12]